MSDPETFDRTAGGSAELRRTAAFLPVVATWWQQMDNDRQFSPMGRLAAVHRRAAFAQELVMLFADRVDPHPWSPAVLVVAAADNVSVAIVFIALDDVQNRSPWDSAQAERVVRLQAGYVWTRRATAVIRGPAAGLAINENHLRGSYENDLHAGGGKPIKCHRERAIDLGAAGHLQPILGKDVRS